LLVAKASKNTDFPKLWESVCKWVYTPTIAIYAISYGKMMDDDKLYGNLWGPICSDKPINKP
jgi:hypothetical protein